MSAVPVDLDERWPHAQLLVVDDEPGMRSFLQKALAPRCAQVRVAESAEEAEQLMARHRFDLLLLDITLPGKSGLVWLRELQAQRQPAEVLLMTAYADLETAIEALRAGAGDLLLKPFRMGQVLTAVQQGLVRGQLKRENWLLRRALHERRPAADGLVGSSLAIRGLRTALQRVAQVDSTVLLSGASGTGKELAALALHRLSRRAEAPFVPVNCAQLSTGALEAELFGESGRDGLLVYAQGGTLFLDEVAELPPAAQASLLRVLESRQVRPLGGQQEVTVDVRIVAATNKPLRAEVDSGRFRADLYWRLQVVEINLPLLAAHKEDIPELVAHFNASLSRQLGVAPIEVSADEMGALQQYDWPGNVRELRNLIERSLIVGTLNLSALYQRLARPDPMAGPALAPAGAGAAPAPIDLQTLEKRHILAVLASVDGDKGRAAALLGISRRTLERRCSEWAA